MAKRSELEGVSYLLSTEVAYFVLSQIAGGSWTSQTVNRKIRESIPFRWEWNKHFFTIDNRNPATSQSIRLSTIDVCAVLRELFPEAWDRMTIRQIELQAENFYKYGNVNGSSKSSADRGDESA